MSDRDLERTGAGARRSSSSIALLAISPVDADEAQRKPGLPGDECRGQPRQEPHVRRELYLSGNPRSACSSPCSASAPVWTVICVQCRYVLAASPFLKSAMRMDDTWAEIIVGLAAASGMSFFVIFGRLSDKVGRKLPIVVGYFLTLVLVFPCSGRSAPMPIRASPQRRKSPWSSRARTVPIRSSRPNRRRPAARSSRTSRASASPIAALRPRHWP